MAPQTVFHSQTHYDKESVMDAKDDLGSPLPYEQVVIIGGSVAGLLAARILSKHFKRVIIVERDRLADNPEPRKGAPQARHGHAVLAKAVVIFDELFPGFSEELQACGAIKVDMCQDVGFFHFGRWKKRFSSHIYSSFQTRTFLEWKLRQRVAAITNVTFCDETDVQCFTMDQGKTRVTGIEIQHRDGRPQAQETITADLIVDTSGRGSRTGQWLESFGYPRVEELAVPANLGYSTHFFRRIDPLPNQWKTLFVFPEHPKKRLGVIFPTEDPTQWLVTLGGVFGDYPPTNDAGFLEFARSLAVTDLFEIIKNLEPIGQIQAYKLPSNLRRCYERMARFPDSLVVLGDALCSFNPIYGQGMTTAALNGQALGRCLEEQKRLHQDGSIAGLSTRFQKQAAAVIANPWLLATAEDMRYPELNDQASPIIHFLHWYTGRVHNISDKDELAAFKFAEVMNMMRSPFTLFDPKLLWRTLTKTASA
jgi:2-polyprenyl-6-methoxyphenol hydroxylase-like FAD-dependent oxidoreductase